MKSFEEFTIHMVGTGKSIITEAYQMNKERRGKLEEIQSTLSGLQSTLEEVKSDEENALESLPDNLRDSEKAETMQTAIEAMENALTAFDEIDSYISEALA
jgi:DNA repair exonuclease SbcCD ATPase subunit